MEVLLNNGKGSRTDPGNEAGWGVYPVWSTLNNCIRDSFGDIRTRLSYKIRREGSRLFRVTLKYLKNIRKYGQINILKSMERELAFLQSSQYHPSGAQAV